MMTTITTRSAKGSQLTWDEVDANFEGLNSGKAEKGTVEALITSIGDTSTDFVAAFQAAME